jgi:hypothetical protein
MPSSRQVSLMPHPALPPGPVKGVDVSVAPAGADLLSFRYTLSGHPGGVRIPARRASVRADELWRHTCFEAFLLPDPGEAYAELNLAPSTQWAAYAFTGYREGMAPAPIAAPSIALTQSADTLDLAVQLNLAGLGLSSVPCRLALSAVIEETAGAKSYWALAHAPGRPDFHHRSSFACRLPATNGV